MPHIASMCYGRFEKHTGKGLNQIALEGQDVLQPYFMQEHNIDMVKKIKEHGPSIFYFDKTFNVPLTGAKDMADYYDKASSNVVMADIKTPTFFLNTLDDPYIGP